ncbi:MAG: hypothetical protein DCF16_17085 [Alphaproteobacteria bacterium]|nr:MAG: hypothetical protein DCF16_17085 [Alphaproteobacteria bacterium]
MDYLLLARIAKLVGLMGFLLPWVTVSCSGNVILEATGLQLMTGDPQPAGALAGAEQNQTDDAEPAVGVILAFAVAAIGLVVGFLLKGKRAAGAMLAGAVLCIGLSFYSIENMRTELTREMNEQSSDAPVEDNPFFSGDQQREFARAAASAIRIEEEEGFWVTVGGMGVGGVLCLLVLAGVGGAVRREEQSPN